MSVEKSSILQLSGAAWWLALADVGGIGWKAYADLLSRFEKPEAALRALASGAAKVPKVSPDRAAAVCASIEHYESAVRRCADIGITIVRCTDAGWPSNLEALTQQEPPSPRPPFLYMKGSFQAGDSRCAALVGSLTPSADGVKRAHRLARLLVESGFTIVSGLARGIDTASHTAALAAGGRTLAVVGTGLDMTYPPENAGLAAQIEQHGALFSQFALGVGPQKHTFPMRNQVMSGLSMATIIVEAHAKCGSLIQADFAFKQGRQVYLLRSNLDQPDSAWAKKLVEDGAVIVSDVEDILSTIRSPLQTGGMDRKPLTNKLWGASALAADGASAAAGSAKGGAASAVVVLFDLEGTLYDAAAVMTKAYQHILQESCGVLAPPEALAPLLSGSPYALLGRWLPKSEVKRAYALYDKVYPACLEQCGRLFEGVDQVIEHLHRAGFRTGVVTSQTRRRADRVTAALPLLAKAAEVLVTWDDVNGRIKPDPYPIQLAVAKLNVKPTALYYVGDSTSDIVAGRRAGAKTVAVGWGLTPLDLLAQQNPDYTIQALTELPAILRSAG